MMEKEELIRDILERLQLVNDVVVRYVPNSWMDVNLSIAQVKSLFFISTEGTTNCRKLATALNVTPQAVTGIVARLVRPGLVTREVNQADRRLLTLKTTQKGEALVSTLRERRVSRMSEIFTLMNNEDLANLADAMKPVVKAANARKLEGLLYKGKDIEPKEDWLPI